MTDEPEDDPGIRPDERETVERASGGTASEKYLQMLCERSFLRFWSHPCVFQDSGVSQRAHGKELCDLLVVFGNDVLIFSDKHCDFPAHDDIHVAWSRWFKRAVQAGDTQIFGAERWLKSFPDRLFLDPRCTRRFPFPLPPASSMRVHRIVVAHGASAACKSHFGGGSGSLMIDSTVVGDAHIARHNPSNLFTIGQIDPSRGYVHVFDDTTLDVVMRTLDTIADFVAYLNKKEAFIGRMIAVLASGEEELLAFYLTKTKEGGHDFVMPADALQCFLPEGHWEGFRNHPSRLAQIAANRVSYVWDELIERFSHHIMTGTQQYTTSSRAEDSEKMLRFLAGENRTRRRMLAECVLTVIQNAGGTKQFVRICQSTKSGEPDYVLLSAPSTHARDEGEYRFFRRKVLESYCLVYRLQRPEAKDIVGIAFTPASEERGSEDLVYFDGRNWTPEMEAEAVSLQVDLNILQTINPVRTTYHEYPRLLPRELGQRRMRKKVGMNAPCPCGSGKKFKKCCRR